MRFFFIGLPRILKFIEPKCNINTLSYINNKNKDIGVKSKKNIKTSSKPTTKD